MRDVIFITGNQRKADYLAKWLGADIAHHRLDLDEIQSLDPRKVAEHKARQAYEILKRPVLVDDTSLTLLAMGRLPGPLIKWFLEEIGTGGLCRLAAGLEHQRAEARVTYGFCDGRSVRFFEATAEGSIAPEPRGEQGMGWDPIFIPAGSTKTFGQMTDDEKKPYSARAAAIEKLREFLQHD